MEQEIKVCQNCKKDFTIEPDDFAFYEKIKVPAPTFCPECRLQRRLAFRNERALYMGNGSIKGCKMGRNFVIFKKDINIRKVKSMLRK